MVTETLRETGTGENQRPTPTGDYDGSSRVEALRAMIERVHTAEAKRDARPRWHRWLFGPALVPVLLVSVTTASAQITWTGSKLTPQQAADVLRPNQYRPSTCEVVSCAGPTVASTQSAPGALGWQDWSSAWYRGLSEAPWRSSSPVPVFSPSGGGWTWPFGTNTWWPPTSSWFFTAPRLLPSVSRNTFGSSVSR